MSAIELYARETFNHSERVVQTMRWLGEAALTHAGRIVQATSLGAEDMVLTDLIARHQLNIPLATLNTGLLHPQTLQLIERMNEHYGLKVQVFYPQQESVVDFVQLNGERAMYESIELRQRCCHLRKMEPLNRMLAGRQAWITGLRRDQSSQRQTVNWFEPDSTGRSKYNPLAEWSWADVWHYIDQNQVPYNPLHDQFMPSIGCAPCTRAIAVGEDVRAGRWWWESAQGESAKECGLHVRSSNEPSTTSTQKQAHDASSIDSRDTTV
jgi:phosphoadenosine phosphosulfate reductase